MSRRQRTRIDTIARVGEELSTEQMRLAAGGDYETVEIGGGSFFTFFYCNDRYDGYISNDGEFDGP
jgi:hypothetical protein